MNTKLFRKSSIDRVNSPEQLNDYIRVANPGVWLILAAIVVMLGGVVIWGVFGTVETTVETGAVVENGTAICYVSETNAARVEAGMSATVDGIEGSVVAVAETPVQVDEAFSDYLLYLTDFAEGDFCYAVTVELAGVSDGEYAAVLTLDSTHPISFVIH